MTDKEMLELAAKAAGMTLTLGGYLEAVREDEEGRQWNSLTDDGDAMRLAVKLHINIEIWNVDNLVRANIYILHRGHGCFEERYTVDPYAATRRAIVRAAAEIGKEMK